MHIYDVPATADFTIGKKVIDSDKGHKLNGEVTIVFDQKSDEVEIATRGDGRSVVIHKDQIEEVRDALKACKTFFETLEED